MKVSQRSKRKIRRNVVGFLYISPVILGILLFTLLPIAYAFICSFFDMRVGSFRFSDFGEFVGLRNYYKNFTVDTYRFFFFRSVRVTFIYAIIYIPLSLVLSFALALLLNQKLKGMRIYRTLFYLPVLIPAVCSGVLWNRLTDVDYGVLNNMLNKIGLPSYGWFSSPATGMQSFVFVSLFGIGGSMILWLAQLKNVPASVYESARLDGAGKACQLFRITIPLCSPMILYNMIMSIIAVLQTYAQVVTLTGGDSGLNFYVMNIYEFYVREFGYASALSFILFAVIALLTFITMKTSKWVYYGEES